MNFLQLLSKLTSISLLTSIVTLSASLIFAKIMIPEDFGRFSYFQSILMILLNFTSFGSGLAIVVYMYNSTSKKYSRIFSNVVFVLIPISSVLSFLVLIILSLVSSNPIDWVDILLLTLNSLFMVVCLTGVDYLRAKQDIKRYSRYFGGYTAVVSIGGILGYLLFQSITFLYLTILVGLLLPATLTLLLLRKELKLNLKYKEKFRTFKWSVKYGVPVVLNSSVMSFMVIGDRILLGDIIEMQALAGYSVAALIASTTLFLVNNFANAWGGYISKVIPKLERKELAFIYYKNRPKLLLAIPLGILAYIAQIIIYKMFYEEAYPGLESIILILTAGYCFLGMSKYFVGFLSCLGKNNQVLYSSVLGCCVMILTSMVFFRGSLSGMAVAVSISFLVQLFMCNFFANKLIKTE